MIVGASGSIREPLYPPGVSEVTGKDPTRYGLTYLLPGTILLLLVFVVPITLFLSRSFLDPGLTSEHFLHIFETVSVRIPQPVVVFFAVSSFIRYPFRKRKSASTSSMLDLPCSCDMALACIRTLLRCSLTFHEQEQGFGGDIYEAGHTYRFRILKKKF